LAKVEIYPRVTLDFSREAIKQNYKYGLIISDLQLPPSKKRLMIGLLAQLQVFAFILCIVKLQDI